MISYTAPKIAGIKIGKKIRERSVKELVGSSIKEFMNSDRYETIALKNPHIIVFKIVFEKPWNISVN